MDGKRATRGARIWLQSSERMSEEGDQAGGDGSSALLAMVASAPLLDNSKVRKLTLEWTQLWRYERNNEEQTTIL
jgi:hypothetical protein